LYPTLYAALEAAPVGTANNPTVVVLLKDITVPESGMEIYYGPGGNNHAYAIKDKHITLTVEPGARRTIKPTTDNFGLFAVQGTTTLTLDGGSGLLTLDGSEVPSGSGGNVTDNAELIIKDNVVITGFYCPRWGGGFGATLNGKITMLGGTITGNSAEWGGGGIAVFLGASFTMSGGVITGNYSPIGGGVWVEGGTFIMSGGTVYGTDAPESQANKSPDGASLHNAGTARYGGTLGSGDIQTTDLTLPPK
jgi:hypothetical protein